MCEMLEYCKEHEYNYTNMNEVEWHVVMVLLINTGAGKL